jgi:alkane 1-monooxygenase
MKFKALKYTLPIIVYSIAFYGFTGSGVRGWILLITLFGVLPLAELFLKGNTKNFNDAEAELAKKDRMYDYVLYLIVPLQYLALVYFLIDVSSTTNVYEQLAKSINMGLLCGTFGINVGHELGHRRDPFERMLAKCLLLTSLYTHFYVEHNKGHHKNVATPNDPSSAKRNEPVYTFYFRTIALSYISAWRISFYDMKKYGYSLFSGNNEMLRLQAITGLFVYAIYLIFGLPVLFLFLLAAFVGILMLETVNYVEHYGLQRKKTSETSYERTMPWHSWNSNHVFGRLLLFELSRHSDHHYMASKKYQVLDNQKDAPLLPTGYPGSMLLSLVPPLWFGIMNKKIDVLNAEHSGKPAEIVLDETNLGINTTLSAT